MARIFTCLLALAVSATAVAQETPEIGQELKDLAFKTVKGVSGKLSDLRGKVVVLTFWSNACPSGKRVMGTNKDVSDWCSAKKRKKDVVFLGIASWGENLKDIKKYHSQKRLGYDIIFDGDHTWAKALAAEVVTTSAIIDKEGLLVYYGGLHGRDPNTGEFVNYLQIALEEVYAGDDVSIPTSRARG